MSASGYKKTLGLDRSMSALCQKRTFAYRLKKYAVPASPSGRLRSQINETLRLQLSNSHHAAFVGNDEAWQQIFER